MGALGGPGAGIPGYRTPGMGPNPNLVTVPKPSPQQAEHNYTMSHTVSPADQARSYLQRITAGDPLGVQGSFVVPKLTQKGQQGTNNRPSGSAGTSPFPTVKAPNQTPQQIVAQLNTLVKSLGVGGPKVPAALTLAHIASLVNQLPTHANIPSKFSLGNVAAAMTPGKNTPGYTDPTAAANAAADATYGGAITQDQTNVAQTQAQNAQNLQDIQNWYNTMTQGMKDNAASDAQGWNAAIQGTGNLGSVATALGAAPGSAIGDTIDQTGSILNAAARMSAASGAQLDHNLLTNTGLGGIQDYENQKNKDAVALAAQQNTLNSDQKARGNAFTTAYNAANQANVDNARNYSQSLGQINSAYQGNFQNLLKAKAGVASTLAGLNGQYTAQGLNAIKTRIAALTSAAGIEALPGQLQGAAAKANLTNAQAYEAQLTGQANKLKGQAALLKAQNAGTTSTSNVKNMKAYHDLATSIVKGISGDPRIFGVDPLKGTVSLKNAGQAKNDIADMLLQMGLDPRTGVGKLMYATTLDELLGVYSKKK